MLKRNKKQPIISNQDDGKKRPLFSEIFQLSASILSGVLLAMSFPGFTHHELVFVGLVPLLYAVHSVSIRRAALLGWLSGLVFFAISLSWLSNLTNTVEGFLFQAVCIIAYLLLAAFCGLFFVPVAMITSACIRKWGTAKFKFNLLSMVAITSTWAASEYLRSFVFTGFPWNNLGVSQYMNTALIQISSFGGVYFVSACIVWFSAAAFITLMQYTHGGRAKKYKAHFEIMLGILPIAIAIGYGFQTVMSQPTIPNRKPVRVALIQPNIEQKAKWDVALAEENMRQLDRLTELATHGARADLIIWPETAVPDCLRMSETSSALVKKYTDKGFPILTGSLDYNPQLEQYYNSSFLIGKDSQLIAKYDKQHLVPFGEYMPFPFIRKYTPIEMDITAGTESTLFELSNADPFSVLICFEDIVAPLSAKAVKNGARWLVNQTNDGWFEPSAQPEQHLANAIFRAVENRVPLVRCCNTGISCVIDAYGRVERELDGKIAGFTTSHVYPAEKNEPLTFYTRYGDVFAKLQLVIAASFAIFFSFSARYQKKHIESE